MIDTYMDRADAVTGWMQPIHEDPRYWGGKLYDTVIERNAAKARALLKWQLLTDVNNHRHEIQHDIRLGSQNSIFEANGRMKS
jgi:hypothetical protein